MEEKPVKQQAPGESDAIYRAAIETSADGFMLLDAEGRLLEVNSAYVKRSGYAREELLAMRITDLEARESPGETARQIGKVIREGRAVFESLHRAKDGSLWQAEVNASHGDIEGGRVCCFLKDVTDRTRVEDELRASREQYRQLFTEMTNGLLVFDVLFDDRGRPADYRLVDANPACERISGLRMGEYVGKSGRELPFGWSAELLQRFYEVAVTGRSIHYERFNETLGRHYETHVFAPRRGQFAHLFQDVTERRQRDIQLERDRSLLRLIAKTQLNFIKEPSATDVFGRMLNDLLVLMDSEYGFVGEVFSTGTGQPYLKTHAITNIAWSDETRRFYADHETTGFEFLNLDTLFGEVLKTGCAVVSNDPGHDPRRGGLPQGHPDLKAFLGIPFTIDGKLVGMAGIANRPGGYDQEAVDYLNPFATVCANIIAAFRLAQNRWSFEDRLRQSESTYRGILDSLSEAVYILDETGTFIDVNQGAERMYGYAHAELVGKSPALVSAPGMNDLGRVMEQCRQALAGTPQQFEFWGRTRDERIFLKEVHLYPGVYFGKPAVVAIAQDITERKQAESRLQSSEREYRELVETANSVILTWNTVGEITFLNDYGARFFGFDLEEILGRNVLGTIVPPTESSGRDLARLMQEIQVDPDRFRDNENENLRKDGTRVWVRWANKAITDEEGRLAGILSVGYDITARRQAEARLQESEQFIRGILDTVDEGFIVIDRDYRILTANKAYSRQVAKPGDEVIGRHCYEVSHKSSRPCHAQGEECAVRDAFASGESRAVVHRHHDPDGHLLHIETKAFPIKDASGTVTSVIETLTNITEKHLLAEERLRAQKLESIGTLAGGIAHDFNNLLQGVFGYISMAKIKLDDPGRSLAMLEQAEKALHMSVGLTKQLLTFSKGGAPVKKLIDLAPVVENSVKFALSGSNVNYRIRIDQGLRMVDADEGQLAQVVQNIVLNADQAMPLGGTISIDATNVRAPGDALPPGLAAGDYVAVAVRDTGIGIPEQYLAKLFDPYFTTKEKGSGLGLATSYSIVKNHGGTIDVASTAGKGTTFTIYLPAAARGAAPPEPPAAISPSRAGRVLVMDDEPVVREIAGEMIRVLGHEVELVQHGAEAISSYREAREAGQPFDVVILDLTIRGGLGGRETLERLRELDPEVRAIVSSGYSDDAVVADYRAHGFQARLSKPYRLDALQAVLASLLTDAPPAAG